jgi:hypothetical protein
LNSGDIAIGGDSVFEHYGQAESLFHGARDGDLAVSGELRIGAVGKA